MLITPRVIGTAIDAARLTEEMRRRPPSSRNRSRRRPAARHHPDGPPPLPAPAFRLPDPAGLRPWRRSRPRSAARDAEALRRRRGEPFRCSSPVIAIACAHASRPARPRRSDEAARFTMCLAIARTFDGPGAIRSPSARGPARVRRRDDVVDQPDLRPPARVDDVGREDQLLRARQADQPRQEPRASPVRNEPDLREDLAESGAVRGDDEIAAQREVAAGAHREPSTMAITGRGKSTSRITSRFSA